MSEYRDAAVLRFAATHEERLDRMIRDGRFTLLTQDSKRVWMTRPSVALWQAVALFSGIEPSSIGRDSNEALALLDELRPLTVLEPAGIASNLHEALWKSTRALPMMLMDEPPPTGDLRAALIAFDNFESWAELGLKERIADRYGWLQPGACVLEAERVARRRDGGGSLYTMAAALVPVSKWPWGSHETALLTHLAKAAELWRTVDEGGNYVPSDPTTAPTNEQIEHFLERRGVTSKKTREVMATILRADDLPSGPRRSTK